jgi:hypothetical protein
MHFFYKANKKKKQYFFALKANFYLNIFFSKLFFVFFV